MTSSEGSEDISARTVGQTSVYNRATVLKMLVISKKFNVYKDSSDSCELFWGKQLAVNSIKFSAYKH